MSIQGKPTTDTCGVGPVPKRPELADTVPELFRHSPEDTKRRCYMCGKDQDDATFDDGVNYAIRELRKWLHQHMTGSEAIAVTDRFRNWVRG